MEVSIFALEKLILENKEKISNCSKQLQDIRNEKIKVTSLKQASIENTLEEATLAYETYKHMYDEIPKEEKDKYKELIRVQEALAKQTYYKMQKIRLKRNKNLSRDQKLEAMMIIDELPEDVNFNDKELLEISQIVIKNNIRKVSDLENELQNIKNEFNSKINKLPDNKDLKHFTFLDSYIPIVILHFSILVQNINELINEHNDTNEKKLKFSGFPKYEDWWIEELFINHQAYFALYKWKDIINNQCVNQQQKIIWNKIFNNWLMVKKILNSKDENAYDYNYIFDEMLEKYVNLEEELDIDNLKSMEEIIKNITIKEDFTKNKSIHNIKTTYYNWKKEKQSKD
jgi:hypothetical protein